MLVENKNFMMVHQLRLKKCRIFKNYELDQKLLRRFQLNQLEQMIEIKENEYAYIEKDQEQNAQPITIILVNARATNPPNQINIRQNSPVSRFNEFINKQNDEIAYFYYRDLQLLPQYTLQEYYFQNNDVIHYYFMKKQSSEHDLRILVKSGDQYFQISMSATQQFQDVLDKMSQRHSQSKDFNLFYQNSLIDPKCTPKQLGIKYGQILQYKHLVKLDEGENTVHLSILIKENVSLPIQIFQSQTPSQLINRLFNQTCTSTDINNYRLVWFTKKLLQNQTLIAQGIEEGDELGLEKNEVIENENLNETMNLNYLQQDNQQYNITLEKIKSLETQLAQMINLVKNQQQIPIQEQQEEIWEEPIQQVQHKSWKKNIKQGLIAQFQCFNAECVTKQSKIYQSFGLGSKLLSNLACICPMCQNEQVQNIKFGVLVCEYIVTKHSEVIEDGRTNEFLVLNLNNYFKDIQGIKIITTNLE